MRMTEHFTLHEFRCRCGCGAEHDWLSEIGKTADALEGLRERINSKPEYIKYRAQAGVAWKQLAITVNCGVRCPAHNAAVGGAGHSKHLSTAYEGAADTWVRGLPPELWFEETEGFFKGRILYIKKNFVHVDRRVGNSYVAINDPENLKEV